MSTPSNDPSIIIIDRVIKQFDRRANSKDALFLYDEVFSRMFEKFDYIKSNPKTIIDLGCADGRHYINFRQRFKNAQYIGVDASPQRIARCHEFLSSHPSQKKRLFGPKPVSAECMLADMAFTGLMPESADLIFSNLTLHCHPNPMAVFNECRRLLRVDGLLLFSVFGPSTFKQLRDAIKLAGLKNVRTHPYIDMHDYGDMLMECGFADPVMDQEILTLTYKSSKKLLDDIYAFGGNACALPQSEIATKSGYLKLCEALEQARNAAGQIELTIEIAYGHAWKLASYKKGQETRVSLESLRSSLIRK